MTLKVGKSGRSNFLLPLDIATQAMAVHGVRGRGKTVTVTVLVEELLDNGIQVVVIDPTDVWWGLKSSRSGARAGYPVVILGGHHGDIPLQSTSGSVIADFAVDHGASMILSLRHLRKGEQRRFVTEFAEQLFHRKGEVQHRTPLFLAIDEASQFVPQRVMGDQARMVGAIQDIVRLGRSAGLGCALIDQRPATVNKDVLTQIELLVCHAVTSPQDRKALLEWVSQKDSAGHQEEFLEHLASMPTGEAWFWLPIADVFERVKVRMRRTFDSSKTPDIGKQPEAPRKQAEVDLDALRESMESTIAEAEANDPKILKKRIAELGAAIRELESREAGTDAEDIAAMVRDQVDTELAVALEEQRRKVRVIADDLAVVRVQLLSGVGDVEEAVDALREFTEDEDGDLEAMDKAERPVRLPAPRAPVRRETKPPPPRRKGSGNSDVSLSVGERKILTAIAQHERGVTREQLSVLTAYKRSSRDTYLQRLRAKGLVITEGGTIVATMEGIDALGPDYEPLPTGDALCAHWLGQLPQGERAVLEVVVAGYPDAVARDDISEATGYKRSSRDTYLQRLKARQLVLKDGSGMVRASHDLFSGLRR